ncbi:hypothetical protein [Aquimarina sp. 2201CG5-10]|uniref:hypothetical protein n=1 Tax=Aquimarina callyspongiae TaxID=3098150 RepID=UPI002AB390FF|nr:hypothetical protein [Aquimarina sp. 2201CG5-10]MDY8135877.1 hypothetical protein [Aquimarina sp. 2201CG5-10]
MKLLLLIAMLCVSYVSANTVVVTPVNEKENSTTDPKKRVKKEVRKTKNFHSIKKWKMTIKFSNGNVISKTIVVQDDSNMSAMETAFVEAEKRLKTFKNVKWYDVTPVSNNSYVLLAQN